MNVSDDFQDVANAIFSHCAPPPVEEQALEEYAPKEKRKRGDRDYRPLDGLSENPLKGLVVHFVLSCLIGAIILIFMAGLWTIFVPKSHDPVPCRAMSDWSLGDIPVRCLSELAGEKSR